MVAGPCNCVSAVLPWRAANLTDAERENLWWQSVIGDAIYGLRHQPEYNRETIAEALVNALEAGMPRA